MGNRECPHGSFGTIHRTGCHSNSEIKEMIERTHALPVTRQYQIPSLARSTAYYRSPATSEADLGLMRQIDELHLDYPFADSHKHVATLMKKIGIPALTRSPIPAVVIPLMQSGRRAARGQPSIHKTPLNET